MIAAPSAARRVTLEFDSDTGLLSAIALDGDAGSRLPVMMAVRLLTGGHEVRGSTGGIDYSGTVRATRSRMVEPPRLGTNGLDELVVVTTDVDGWVLTWTWGCHPSRGPAVSVVVDLTPPQGSGEPLRDFSFDVTIAPEGVAQWCVTAPGNRLRRAVRVADLPPTTSIEPPGGSRGSSGIIYLESPEQLSLVVWPFCRTELAQIAITTVPGTAAVVGVTVSVSTRLAGDVAEGDWLRYEGLYLDLSRSSWEVIREGIPRWYSVLGVTAPRDAPVWVPSATIYEVFVGSAPFWGKHSYAPYPTVAAVMSDLDRIQSLGQDTIQLMPQHPYPSYNVHDFADISTTYGPVDELVGLVAECHRRGMKVVLDVLMHGIIDQESIRSAADRVRSGPYSTMLDTDPGDIFGADPSESWRYGISWSRHILDFEEHWAQGAPVLAPLTREHPEWFTQDSEGIITGVYTKAFDARNPGFQDWFIEQVHALAQKLDIDGFRLDAPTYNQFGNWSRESRHRSSASVLACLELFRRLRPVMRAWKPDFLLYTEPSGVLHRESMDLTYNYDEQFLVGAGLGQFGHGGYPLASVRDGADVSDWLEDRDALLPFGALTCHHIDSHDTFWWPTWGGKWRREQFGLGGVKAMTALFMLCGGPFMTFVGGEVGIESELAALAQLRRDIPAIARGATDFGSVQVDDRAIVAFTRRFGKQRAIVAVNLSHRSVDARLTVTDPLAAERALTQLDLRIEPFDYRVIAHMEDENDGKN